MTSLQNSDPFAAFGVGFGKEFESSLVASASSLFRAPRYDGALRYTLKLPGKRIRPVLFLSACKDLFLEERSFLPVAVSLEMLHVFTLIHDDLPCMDNSSSRRGKPSNHLVYGEAQALLAGDALIFDAIANLTQVSINAGTDASKVIEAIRWVCKKFSSSGIIGGQAIELELGAPQLETQLILHKQKTGALFELCFVLPAIFAGQSSTIERRSNFGSLFGQVFQAIDDLEDCNDPVESEHPKSMISTLGKQGLMSWIEAHLDKLEQEAAQIFSKEFSNACLLLLRKNYTMIRESLT